MREKNVKMASVSQFFTTTKTICNVLVYKFHTSYKIQSDPLQTLLFDIDGFILIPGKKMSVQSIPP